MRKSQLAKIRRWIVLPDIHLPYHDRDSLAAVEKMMGDYKFDGWLCLGDLMDFNVISNHNLNNLRVVEGQRIMSDYRIVNEFLDRHQAIIRKNNPKAQFVLIEGNHDQRILRYIDANPAVEGMLEVPVRWNYNGEASPGFRFGRKARCSRSARPCSSMVDTRTMATPKGMSSDMDRMCSMATSTTSSPIPWSSIIGRSSGKVWDVYACLKNTCKEHRTSGNRLSRCSSLMQAVNTSSR